MVVYVLKSKDDFYSIDRFSLSQIKSGSGSTWTKLHLPVSVVEIVFKDEEFNEDFDEDDLVLEYMSKYGIDKVRGGRFNNTVLSEYQMIILNKRLKKNDYNYDYNYSKTKDSFTPFYDNNDNNGFTTVVYDSLKKNQSTTILVDSSNTVSSSENVCSYCEMSFANDTMLKKHEQNCINTYFTKSKNDGKQCDRCGRHTHTTQYCKAKTDIHGYSI